ncbi:MAG: hypothetical protein O3A66_01725 [Proteobacteria bacterium]|jgi:hypothetical protein|nr:hypothetical protein [Pseudomonadota bacterium]
MSLITNIIHDDFALVVANQAVEERDNASERIILNKNSNVMIAIAGEGFPENYAGALEKCSNHKEAIAIVQEYINTSFATRTLLQDYNTVQPESLQQMCLTYFDENKQKFCSYAASVSNQQRNTDIKGSIANQVLFRCIGSDSEQLTMFFQLKGVRAVLQKFALERKGADAVMDIIDIVQRMYDAVDLIDHSITFDSGATFWAMDKDSKTFQKVEYNHHYIIEKDTQQNKQAA